MIVWTRMCVHLAGQDHVRAGVRAGVPPLYMHV